MKLRILCIDDSKSVHAFLKECVSELAKEFTSAYDGEEGLTLLKEKHTLFDCVFLDWEMPKKTGPEVLREARNSGINLPIIMLTSKNQTTDISDMLKYGASEYIMKPFTKDIIVERLNTVMNS